jgi:hypothetical protein
MCVLSLGETPAYAVVFESVVGAPIALLMAASVC